MLINNFSMFVLSGLIERFSFYSNTTYRDSDRNSRLISYREFPKVFLIVIRILCSCCLFLNREFSLGFCCDSMGDNLMFLTWGEILWKFKDMFEMTIKLVIRSEMSTNYHSMKQHNFEDTAIIEEGLSHFRQSRIIVEHFKLIVYIGGS